MAFSAKYLTFQKPATGTGVQSITGVGFQGVALIIWSERSPVHGQSDSAKLTLGMTDGVRQTCRSINHPDNEASTTGAQVEYMTRLVVLTNATSGATPTVEVEGNFAGFTADGFDINWLTNSDGFASIFHCVVLGGGVQAYLKEVKLNMLAGESLTMSGIGFEPEAFIAMGGAVDEFSTGATFYRSGQAGSIHGYGFSDGNTNISGWTLGRGYGGAQSYRGQHNDRLLSIRLITIDNADPAAEAIITGSTPDGFVIKRTQAWNSIASHRPYQHILCLRGVHVAIGSITTPTVPGSTQPLPLGFPAQLILMQTCEPPVPLTGGKANDMAMSIGAWGGDLSNQGGTWIGGRHNVLPSVYARSSYTGSIIKSFVPFASGVDSDPSLEVAVAAIGDSEATLQYGAVPGTPTEIIYIAFADSGELPPLTYASSRWAKVPIPNPVSHYGGFIEPRLKTAGTFMRAISDRTGRHEISSFQFTLKDLDRQMKMRAAGATSQFMDNCTIIARTQSDEDRRAFLPARTLGIGLVKEHKPKTPGQYEFRCDEYLSKYIGSDRSRSQIPKRKFEDHIPGVPYTLRGKPEQICYGDLTSGASTAPAPVINLKWADGGFFNPDIEGWRISLWHMGWGTLTSTAAIPSGVAVAVSSGGSINMGDGPLNLYNVAVTAVDSLGQESDPIYFNWHEPNYPYFGQITADGQKIEVTWAPAAGAVGYRVYVGYANHDTAFMRFQTFNTGVTIDRVTPFGQTPAPDNIATGAEVITFAESWLYAVSALMSDGETVLSQICYGKSQGYRRPLKIEWYPVAGATGYRVYRKEVKFKGLALGTAEPAEEHSVWDRHWDVASTDTSFSDDLLNTGATFAEGTEVVNGMVQVKYCGDETSLVDGSTWKRFLVAAHAVYQIGDPAAGFTGAFVDGELVGSEHLGATVLIPGHINYTNFFPNTGARCQYRDLNGRRYTFIYARGPVADAVAKGEKVGACNLIGVESKGDSTGQPLLNIVDQYLHFMVNFGYGDYQTGDWGQIPPYWPDVTPLLRVLDMDAFATAKARTLARMPGRGYVGGGVLGYEDFESLDQVIQDFNTSCGCDSYVNTRQQFSIDIVDLDRTAWADETVFTEAFTINKGSFTCVPSNEDWENAIPFNYRFNYQKKEYLRSDTRRHATSIARYRETKEGNEISLRFVYRTDVALNIIESRLDYNAWKPWEVSWDTTATGVNEDVTGFAGFQTREMIGTDPAATHLMRITRLSFNADRFITTLTGRVRSPVAPA